MKRGLRTPQNTKLQTCSKGVLRNTKTKNPETRS